MSASKQNTPSARNAPPLLPNLFSRLTDNAPHESSEPPSAYTLTTAGLHNEIRHDLSHLLNASSPGELIDEAVHSLAAGSCINYGMPPLAGTPLGSTPREHLAALINQAVRRYEPRLMPDSVTLHWSDEPAASGRRGSTSIPPLPTSLQHFEIRATLQAQIYPVEFTVQSAVDLSTQRLTVLGPG